MTEPTNKGMTSESEPKQWDESKLGRTGLVGDKRYVDRECSECGSRRAVSLGTFGTRFRRHECTDCDNAWYA